MLPIFLALHGDRVKRRAALAMRIDVQELPNAGWKIVDQLCVRSGFITPQWSSEVSKRARRTGEFSARRQFEHETPRQELWLQTVPYGSRDDASDAVPRLMSKLVANPSFKGKVVDELENQSISIPGVDTIYAVERWSTGTRYGSLSTRYIIGNVGHIEFVVVYGDWSNTLSWEDVTNVATIQANKILGVATG
jgi:hypothetical protein